ncbi:MAG: hypothetical protein COZ37_05235 [bacterium (Candidatus Ratteibacteria) CG_4_10_14_3_um_filter_41_18]|uniref:Periplasmic heavy metal sensor n=4 Tax=Candidatus Ratteibacteria TaxID=2979319 RepID=A0A2M7YHX6_9BACT|nr:MAG: hypothetical protein AUJ76_02945 [Candidatus Omnitrophica bacterium CG1_02_41_171]PIV63625.1 MAG: hypothetical protein COS11_06450 [bacterium (Candidatus Ratteibacteria) CG01_land_8_20_14_3_00_40_19]PIW32478.1 MAG: hypothetical protein COW28_05955 [bacterium (Candidatus Ratteibacteria) CG15_BIG_FIL_POST_REV_8_21_14_020_41_12]PIW73935.1 MAG: hypothetical protein CO004_03335 [bacterium (Candidatus Ratteibacteria) CG_4_8_14_3_um_filter_41_36]PIX76950.1 MAG: hypothetical protein COZ37_05235
MKSKATFIATLFFGLLLLTTGVKLSAESRAEKTPNQKISDEEREERKGKASEMLETITLWKLVDGLKLTEEQVAKFLPKYREDKDLKKEYQEKRKKIAEELKDLLQDKSSSKKIEEKLTQLNKLEEEEWQKKRALEKELKSILTPEQQAKYIFLQRQIGEEMMQRLRKKGKERKEQSQEKRGFAPEE